MAKLLDHEGPTDYARSTDPHIAGAVSRVWLHQIVPYSVNAAWAASPCASVGVDHQRMTAGPWAGRLAEGTVDQRGLAAVERPLVALDSVAPRPSG